MELIYLVLFVCCLPSVLCHNGECYVGYMLCGFTIFIMFIVIVALSIALYMVKNNKTILGISIDKNPTYIRQESGLGATLCNVTSIHNISDQCRNDGSTLTVNSGIVEIGGLNEPETPTRVEENKAPCLMKKPVKPTIPTIQKAQMDKIIEDVLNRKQKSDSATFRELDALAKPRSANVSEQEFAFRRNSASLNELDAIANSGIHESLYENARSIGFMRNKADVKDKKKLEEKVQTGSIPNITFAKDSRARNVEPEIPVEADEDEQEVYDTLPNPVRCRNSDAESDGYAENLHLYDMPPRKSWEASENRNVVLDHDTQYLLPLSKRVMSEEEENMCYINANKTG